MKQALLTFSCIFLVAGCAPLQWPGTSRPATHPAPDQATPEASQPDVAPVPPAARTVDEFDTTTTAQKAAALSGSGDGGTNLGITIASLGSPTEPGFWLKTPLVDTPAKGRVLLPQNGKSVQVDLIPIDGPKSAGSRMSLAAMRLIEAPFTGLPEVQVYRIGN